MINECLLGPNPEYPNNLKTGNLRKEYIGSIKEDDALINDTLNLPKIINDIIDKRIADPERKKELLTAIGNDSMVYGFDMDYDPLEGQYKLYMIIEGRK